MRRYRGLGLVTISLIAVLLLFSAPVARADQWDLSTTFSVNYPFMVPGKTLEPNTNYVMRLLDTPESRRVVQVYNADESEMLAMFIAIPDWHLDVPNKTEFTFMEVDRGYPKPIQSWFYPGRNAGLDFLYSDDQKLEIAAHQGGRSIRESSAIVTYSPVENLTPVAENVPTATDLTDDELLIALNQQPSELKFEPEVIREKPAEPIAEAAVTAPEPQAENRELPRTAGELPMLGLMGALSLGLGFGVRLFSKG